MAKKEFSLTDNRFGALGWKIIVVVSLAFFFSTGITSDGLNVSVPAFVELHGWDREYLLTFSSIGGLVGVVGTILLGRLCTKIGAVNTMRICLLGLGIMLILWGRVTEIWQYGVCICLVMSLMNGYVYVSAPALLGNYFPRKKAIALGWGNLGANASTAVYLPVFTYLVGSLGITTAYLIVAVVILAVFIFTLFFVKDFPEQSGGHPDNDPNMTQEDVAKFKAEEEEYRRTSPWTVKKLLTTKQVWQIGLAGGILMLVTTGTMSQFVTKVISDGVHTREFATTLMSVMAIVAIPMGWLVGYISQKVGVKKTCIGFYIMVIAALVVAVIPGTVALYVSTFLFGCLIGGSNDFQITLGIEVFGRYDYPVANSVIMPICNTCRALSFAIVGTVSGTSLGFTGAYLTLAAIAVVGVLCAWRLKETCIGRQ